MGPLITVSVTSFLRDFHKETNQICVCVTNTVSEIISHCPV